MSKQTGLESDGKRPASSLPCWALGAMLACGVALPAHAQITEAARQRLESVEGSLRAKREAEKGLVGDVRAMEAERERLNSGLLETARRIQDSEARLSSTEGRLGELEAQEKLLRGSLAERHGSISRLLSAMQRMGRDPPPVMITRREDALVMVRSAMMLASSFPQLKNQALALGARLEDLARVMGESRAESEKLRAETQKLTDHRVRLASLMEEKKQSLSERQAALDRVRREAEEISRSVSDINELIEKLDKVVATQSGLPAAGPPVQAPPVTGLVPRATPPPPSSPANATPEAPTSAREAEVEVDRTIVMQPKGPRTASLNNGRIKPAMPFAEAKGRLPLPAQGKRIISFGDKAQASRSSGIVIETRPGAQVVSPSDGWIVYAGVFRSYGQILIINGGDGYHMLLAGLAQIDVQLGQFVLGGEPVGLMGGSARDAKVKAPAGPSAAAVLYVELRKDGRPIDPEPWWATGSSRKVQG